MKKILLMAAAGALLLTASCSDEQIYSDGQGRVILKPTVNTDMAVVSRTLQDDYAASTMIWISDSRGLIRRFDTLDELPGELVLRSGNYTAEAWCGDSVPASFDQRWFKAVTPFTVSDGQTTTVPLTLKIANVGVSVQYDANISDVLRDCRMTVGHTGGSLVFEGETAASRGYFMMPSSTKDLNYKLEASQLGGTPFEFSGVISDVQPANEYILKVVYTPENEEMGAGYFTITIDSKPIPVQNESVELITPPVIKGYGFNLANTITAEQGKVGRRCIYISSATEIAGLLVKSDDLTAIVGGADVNLLQMGASVKETLTNAGINYDSHDCETGMTLLQLNFEEAFTNALLDGEHSFEITATDKDGRAATAVMNINVTDAPVETVQIADGDLSIYTNRATLTGNVLKGGASEYGIEYTGVSRAWARVAATPVNGKFTVELTELLPGTTYQYRAYADDFTGTVCEFTTEEALQVPNAGMEDWDTSGKTYLLYASGGTMYWDSGNHGSSTMSKNVTYPDSNVKHSGNYSAKLESQFVGIGTIGKFAAGNMFVGKYLGTDGTDGIIGWGRPFTSRPSAVKLWVKYIPGTVEYKCDYLSKGDLDQGMIFVALTDATTQSYNNEQWSQVIKTKTKQLFNKDDAKVIAYGEHPFRAATDGDGMVEITIDIDYRRDERPCYLIFVCSASRYGDYFSGGSSTMWVDDIEFVYK